MRVYDKVGLLFATIASLIALGWYGDSRSSLSPQLTALAEDENSSHFSYQAAIGIPG